MIDIGLIATPTPSGSTSPMTLPIPTSVAAPIGCLEIDNSDD
jgi:hypothetical protein